MNHGLLSLLSLLSLAGVAAAQPASVVYAGTGCTTTEGVPTMNNTGTPVMGQSFTLFYTGPNHTTDFTQSFTRPHLAIGFSLVGPVDIPQFLFFNQPPMCTLWNAHDVVVSMQPDQNGRPSYENSVSISIGNDPALLGVVFYAQWLAVHIQCGIAGCGPLPDWIGTSAVAICSVGT